MGAVKCEKALQAHELAFIAAAKIGFPKTKQHIHRPHPDHADRNPSQRWYHRDRHGAADFRMASFR
jgi:hypothetical protein